MNIWQWVENLQMDLAEAGQPHNAQLIENISSYCADQEVEKVEALLPEAKALCKTLENPWLSVYVGHWEMRHRLGNKSEGETALADAVALFELAHREDTQDCPQSVCVTQDLAACYSLIDGPGWANERIAVSEETLARIDTSWNCYKCLSCEKALAIIDQQKPQEALDYLNEVATTLTEAGESIGPGILEVKNDALIALGQYEEVLAHIQKVELEIPDYGEWKNISQPRNIQKAHALARLERDEEALEALPALREMNIGDMFSWIDAIYPVMLRQSDLNNWQIASRLQAALKHLSVNKAHRRVIELAAITIPLAIDRGARWSAQRQLDLARTHLPKLRIDAGASATLEQLQQQIDQMPNSPLPVPSNELLAWLNSGGGNGDNNTVNRADDDSATNDSNSNNEATESSKNLEPPIERNPEQELEWLLVAILEQPDDADLHAQTASAMQACQANDEAIELLRAFMQKHPNDDSNIRFILLELLLENGDDAGVEALAQQFDEADNPVFAQWSLAQLAHQQLDWEGVESHCRQLLSHQPDAYGAIGMLARSLMRQQKFAEAAEQYQALMKANPEDNDYKWDFMTASSAAEDWRAVREVAADLGMEMTETQSTERPYEQWGWVIIRYFEQGDVKDYFAKRTGPVSAVIDENASPNSTQHVGDYVVFDAQVLIPPPEDPEEKENFIPTFAIAHTLEKGNYRNSVFIDGVHPGEAAMEAFDAACREQNWKLWVHSSADYEIIDSGTDPNNEIDRNDLDNGINDGINNDDENATKGTPLQGIMMTIAVPTGVSARQIDAFLTEQTAQWPHKLCWLRLAEEAEVNTQPHLDIIERYGL